MNYPTRAEIEALSREDRLRLIGDVWETLEEPGDVAELPEEHRRILEQRLASLERNPDVTISWEDVLKRARSR